MDNLEQPLPQLKDLLEVKTTRAQFEKIAGQLLSPKDKELFGPEALSKVTMGILYPAVFAPAPATFDEDAYRFTVSKDDEGYPLKKEEVTRLLQIAKGTGIIKDTQDDRLMVDKDIHPIIDQILDQYE